MRCADARRQLGILDYSRFRREDVSPELADHLQSCPDCRSWLADMRRISDLVRLRPAAEVSVGFTQAVMARVSEQSSPPAARRLERLTGALRPTAPAVSLPAILGIVSLLVAIGLVGILVFGPLSHPVDDGPQPAQLTVSADVAPPALVVDADEEMQELILRHQTHELNRPEGMDPGVVLATHSAQ